MNYIHELRRRVNGVQWLKSLYLGFFNLLPVHWSYRLNSRLRSPYSVLEMREDIIYVHIPKAAGNAVLQTLYGEDGTGHDSLQRYYDYDCKRFNSSFKFVIVRNPWDRFVSAYHYLKQGGIGFFDKRFSDKYISKTDSFSDFVNKMNSDKSYERAIMSWIHFVPQVKFLEVESRVYSVDMILRLENISDDYDALSKRLDKSGTVMKKLNQSSRSNYQEYYTEDMARYVGSLYGCDVDYFGYDF